MTPKQIERIQIKIKKFRAALTAEKRKYGWINDDRGLRYAIPELYLKIVDYKGGMTYFRWFNKNFPNDCGMPNFLLEWTITLFKYGKLKDAEKKAYKTFFSNIYIFDIFFEREIIKLNVSEFSNLSSIEFANYLSYTCKQENLKDFAEWLQNIENSEKFQAVKKSFIDLNIKLNSENRHEKRIEILEQIKKIETEYD